MKVFQKTLRCLGQVLVHKGECGQTMTHARRTVVSHTTRKDEEGSHVQRIQSTVADFCEKHVAATAMRYDATGEFPWDVHREAFKAGLTSVSTKHGGLCQGMEEWCELVGEDIAASCSSIFSTIAASIAATSALHHTRDSPIKEYYLSLTAKEPIVSAFVANLHCTCLKAEQQPGGFVLSGHPSFTENASNASFYVVAATDTSTEDKSGLTCFVIDKHLLGVSLFNKLQLSGHRCCDRRLLSFENVFVPNNSVLGEVGQGRVVAEAMCATQELLEAVGALGLARHVIHLVNNECRASDELLTAMNARVDEARHVTRQASHDLDRGRTQPSVTPTIARQVAVKAASHNTQQAMQVIRDSNNSQVLTKLIRDLTTYRFDLLGVLE